MSVNLQRILSPDSYSYEISQLRNAGDLLAAISLCREASIRYPSNSTFHKIAGDMFISLQDYDSASKAYLDYLERLPRDRNSFAQFAQRYYRLRRIWTQDTRSAYATLILSVIEDGHMDAEVALEARKLISIDLPKDAEYSVHLSAEGTALEELLCDKADLKRIIKRSRAFESKNRGELAYLLDQYVLTRPRSDKNFQEDKYWISVYEKLEEYHKALKVAEELLQLRLDHEVVRTFFRLSRKIGSYELVNKFLEKNPHLLKTDIFHVLYELVYYYEYNKDDEAIRATLNKIRRVYSENIPIRKTLRNFYIRFGMIEEASQIEREFSEADIRSNKSVQKYADTTHESELEIGSKIRDLSEELEVAKRLAAISELTTGISHELGQPITNIRYAIQFHRRLFEKHLNREEVFKLFDSILEETKRMGGLVKRLAPLTSSRTVVEDFDLIERINRRVLSEKARLHSGRIKVNVHPNKPVYVHGDPVKFDQLISNLLLNSIDALNEKKGNSKAISIDVTDKGSQVKILFADNGDGIPVTYRNKIFDPFFTTKAPGKGEGLGLFIVWNLLKMQGGQIILDPKFSKGTRFVISIPKSFRAQDSEVKFEEHTTVGRGRS